MMATTAIHQLGDISSEEPDICVIYDEDDKNWIGNWVYGFGFFNIRFPKATTRELTSEEIEYYQEASVQINNNPPYKLNL